MLVSAVVNSVPATGPELPAAFSTALARKLEQRSLDLPVLSDAAQRVMRIALDDDVDPGVLSDAIKRDGAMASHVLRVSNSPLYRGRAAIVSLQQAVSRLGMRKVREIALAVVCESRVFRVRGYDAEVRESFRHSLATAMFAAEIARIKRSNVEEAYLAGLLHDIGRPVLLQAIVDLERELSLQAPHGAALAFAEAHHEEVGGALVTGWELPARLAEAVHDHHVLAEGPGTPLTAIVGLADELSLRAYAPSSGGQSHTASSHLAVLNLYPEDVAVVLAAKERILSAVEVNS